MKNIIYFLIYVILTSSVLVEAQNKCLDLFPQTILDYDELDKEQFLVNLKKKLKISFVSLTDYSDYFEDSNKALIKYTTSEGNQSYYDQLNYDSLSVRSRAISMRSKIESSLFLRKPYLGPVYSGAQLSKNYIDDLSQPGRKINFGYFLSASKDYSIALQFSKINNIYEVPDKRKVIFVINSINGKSIEDVSEFQYEKEVLFSSNSDFFVTSVKDERKNNQDLRIIYLNEAQEQRSENFNKLIVNDLRSKPEELTDWKKGLEYIFANSRNLKYDTYDLKKIHEIVTKNMIFSKSVHREKSLFEQVPNELITAKKSGAFRHTDADYFISNGDHFDSKGHRFFKSKELDGYLDNPFFHVVYSAHKSNDRVLADVHFVSPQDVEKTVSRVLSAAQVALLKSKTERQYLINVFRLYKALISIHPFSDGNGRAIRLFIYGLLIKNNLPIEYFPTLSEYENSAAVLAEDYLNGNRLQLK